MIIHHLRHRPSATTAELPDRGFSIIEVVITIALLGVVVVAILEAVTTSITVSSVSRSAAQVETAVVNASDRVNRAPKRCDYSVYAQAAVQTQGWPADAASVTHEYYVPGANASAPGAWQTGPAGSPGCPGTSPTDLLVQRVTIRVTNPEGGVSRAIEVVKSDV